MKNKVYFAGATGRIKIGTTTKAVNARITAINTHLAEPLEIIGYIDGGLPLERAIQSHLKAWHLKGEWFRDCDEVRDVIKHLILQGPRAINFQGDCFRQQPPPGFSSPRNDRNPHAIRLLAELMWGNRAAAQLAGLAEVDMSIAVKWLENEAEMPRLVRYAMAYAVLRYWHDDDDDFTVPETYCENRDGRMTAPCPAVSHRDDGSSARAVVSDQPVLKDTRT